MATAPRTDPSANVATPAGSLGIKERKTWRTSQVLMFCCLSLLIGMRIGYSGESTAATNQSTSAGQSRLPPDTSTTTVTTVAAGDPSQPTETAAATGPTGDEPPGGPDNTAAPRGRPQVLLEVSQRTGGLTTDTFTAAPGWKLGWSFNCGGQRGSGTFKITPRRPAGEEIPDVPILERNGTTGNGVEEYSSEGEHVLAVETNCLWALRVTGIPG